MLTEALHGRHERIMQVGADRSLPELRTATFEARLPDDPASDGKRGRNSSPAGAEPTPDNGLEGAAVAERSETIPPEAPFDWLRQMRQSTASAGSSFSLTIDV